MDNLNGYKAFEPGMICKGKQYQENTDYEEEGGEICEKGMMHYCVNPFEVLNFYPLVNDSGKVSDFAAVKSLEEPVSGDNGKFATKKLHIGVKLGLPGFVKACIDYLKEETIVNAPNSTVSSGDSAQIGSSGYYAKIGSSGNYAKIGSSGNYAKIESAGEDSVICCAGHGSAVNAKAGSWITLAEWEYSEAKNGCVPKCVKTEYVDGERIKADTWYKLIDGEFTEVSP
jgi:hypothetical protein|nr:MAG TPA: hypothetical protein [Caudoviricetes sp.]